MADDDLTSATDRLLAAWDSAGQSALQNQRHRAETADHLRRLLDVADSLDALESHCRELARRGDTQIPEKSVGIIRRQLQDVLAQAGVRPIEAVGAPVDLAFHFVVSVRDTAEHDDDIIVDEPQRGYLWKDELLRPSRVIVARRIDKTDEHSSHDP